MLQKIREELPKYNKALVPVLLLVIFEGLRRVGITQDMTVEEAVTVFLGAAVGLVYAVPNKKS